MTSFYIEPDKRKKYRWTLIAANGVTICASSQGFTRASAARKNAALTRDGLNAQGVALPK